MEKARIEKMLADCGIVNTDIKELKGNSKGFIIYSEENINTTNNDLKKMYDSVYDEINTISENNIYRYYYYKKLDENNPLHATIVMMNPAFANSEETDDTINNIEKYLDNKHNHFGSFDIVNLYPVRMPKSTKLKDFLKLTEDETEKYPKFVKTYLENNCENHIIIAAWGSDKNDNKKAEELFKDLDIKFYCYGLTKEGYPKHFSSQSYNNFNKFRYPFPFIRINNWLKNTENFTNYDKTSMEDVKQIKTWLTGNPKINQDYVDYMTNLLEEHFNTVK